MQIQRLSYLPIKPLNRFSSRPDDDGVEPESQDEGVPADDDEADAAFLDLMEKTKPHTPAPPPMQAHVHDLLTRDTVDPDLLKQVSRRLSDKERFLTIEDTSADRFRREEEKEHARYEFFRMSEGAVRVTHVCKDIFTEHFIAADGKVTASRAFNFKTWRAARLPEIGRGYLARNVLRKLLELPIEKAD